MLITRNTFWVMAMLPLTDLQLVPSDTITLYIFGSQLLQYRHPWLGHIALGTSYLIDITSGDKDRANGELIVSLLYR